MSSHCARIGSAVKRNLVQLGVLGGDVMLCCIYFNCASNRSNRTCPNIIMSDRMVRTEGSQLLITLVTQIFNEWVEMDAEASERNISETDDAQNLDLLSYVCTNNSNAS